MADWKSLGLDFVTLRVFKAAVEAQSFVGAAEREHLAASAISRRIGEMEARLGIELLRRHDRGVEPTQAGRVLLRHVDSLFDIVAVTLADLESLTEGKTGEVRVIASMSMITSTLPECLGRIKREFQDIDLHLEQGNSEDILVSLRHGSADIGFVSGLTPPADMTSYEFVSEPLAVVVPVDHPLAKRPDGVRLRDLHGSDLVTLRDTLALQQLIARKATGAEVELRRTAIVDGFDALLKYVEVGMGLSIIPQYHAREGERSNAIVVVPLREDWAIRSTHVCVKSVSGLGPAARRVLNAILTARESVCSPAPVEEDPSNDP